MRLRTRDLPTDHRSPDFDELAVEIDISPLKPQQFAFSHPGTDGTEKERVEQGRRGLGLLKQRSYLFSRERGDMGASGLSRGHNTAELGCWIHRHELLINRVVISLFQRRQNVVDRALSQTSGHPLSDQPLNMSS